MYHAMRLDGGNTEKARPFQRRLAGIMSIELPKEDFLDYNIKLGL